MRFLLIEALIMRTTIQVTRAQRTETKVITGWALGTRSRTRAHPTLSHIALLQNVDGVHQILSHWDRRGGNCWENSFRSVVGFEHTFCI